MLPVPDELLGSRLRAVICADGPGGLTREQVLDHCRRLPGYMVPDVVEFREALPRNSNGKIDRAPCLWGTVSNEHERAAWHTGGRLIGSGHSWHTGGHLIGSGH